MAKKKIRWNAFTRGVIGKEALDKIGTYQEAPGGGTPSKGGGRGAMKKDFKVVDSKEEADAIRRSNPDAKIRYNQPRDEDGQFTYNSSNAKELVYGPSRGYTVPPFLRGVELTFVEKGSTLKVKDPKDMRKWTTMLSTINMSPEDMMIKCREYIKSEGGFLGMGEGSAVAKKGRKSEAEKAQKTEGVVNQEKKDVSKLSQSTQDEMAKAQDKYSESSAGKYDSVNDSVFGNDTQEYEDYFKSVLEDDSDKMIKENGLELKQEATTKGISDEIPMAQSTIDNNKNVKSQLETLKTKVKPSGEPVEQNELTEEQQASKLFGQELTKEPEKNEEPAQEEDTEFNSEEIGNTKEEQVAWLKKNKNIIAKIKEKHPDAKYGAIIGAIKSGKAKKLSDFLK